MMERTEIFPGRYDQIRRLCHFVITGANEVGLDNKALFQVELACDEAATNIIEHAYGGEDKGNIRVTLRVADGAFVVEMQDTGTPFDPAAVRPVTTIKADTPVEEVGIGGLGLHFMRELMDELYFSFGEAEGNQVTMVKWLPDHSSPLELRTLQNGLQVLVVRGRLDQFLAQQFESSLTQAAPTAPHPPRLILDLSQTSYIDSGGLRVVVAAWRRARQAGGDMVLHGLNERLREIFGMVGFDQIITICVDRQQALAHFGPKG
jgi:anti-anti-sigma factor